MIRRAAWGSAHISHCGWGGGVTCCLPEANPWRIFFCLGGARGVYGAENTGAQAGESEHEVVAAAADGLQRVDQIPSQSFQPEEVRTYRPLQPVETLLSFHNHASRPSAAVTANCRSLLKFFVKYRLVDATRHWICGCCWAGKATACFHPGQR